MFLLKIKSNRPLEPETIHSQNILSYVRWMILRQPSDRSAQWPVIIFRIATHNLLTISPILRMPSVHPERMDRLNARKDPYYTNATQRVGRNLRILQLTINSQRNVTTGTPKLPNELVFDFNMFDLLQNRVIADLRKSGQHWYYGTPQHRCDPRQEQMRKMETPIWRSPQNSNKIRSRRFRGNRKHGIRKTGTSISRALCSQ